MTTVPQNTTQGPSPDKDRTNISGSQHTVDQEPVNAKPSTQPENVEIVGTVPPSPKPTTPEAAAARIEGRQLSDATKGDVQTSTPQSCSPGEEQKELNSTMSTPVHVENQIGVSPTHQCGGPSASPKAAQGDVLPSAPVLIPLPGNSKNSDAPVVPSTCKRVQDEVSTLPQIDKSVKMGNALKTANNEAAAERHNSFGTRKCARMPEGNVDGVRTREKNTDVIDLTTSATHTEQCADVTERTAEQVKGTGSITSKHGEAGTDGLTNAGTVSLPEPSTRKRNRDETTDSCEAQRSSRVGSSSAETNPQKADDYIVLRLGDAEAYVVSFRIRKTTKLGKLMKMYCFRQSARYGAYRFIFDGVRLEEDQTPEERGMEHMDMIDVMVTQYGGSK